MSAQTLPTGSQERKDVPLVAGCLDYFPAALAAVAAVSKAGNDKHNPGEEMHHARGKSMDHADCIARHLVDRGTIDEEDGLRHSAKVAWRALALLQQELEDAGEAPLARGARVAEPEGYECKTCTRPERCPYTCHEGETVDEIVKKIDEHVEYLPGGWRVGDVVTLERYLEGPQSFRIVAYRPPSNGEPYISSHSGVVLKAGIGAYPSRIIVERVPAYTVKSVPVSQLPDGASARWEGSE